MNNQKMCAIAVVVFFISLYSLFSIGHYGGDGYEDYLTAKSIVLNHSLAFNDKSQNIDELGYKKDLGIKGRDGRIYSSRGGPVIPIILSLFYFFGHIIAGFVKNVPHDFITMFFVSFSNPIISALNCLLIFLISLNLFFSPRLSIVLSFIYGLATMAPVYARTGFAEPAMTAFILFAIYFVLRYKNSAKGKYLILTALSIAGAIFTKSTAVIFLPAFVFYTGWVMSADKKGRSNLFKNAGIFFIPLTISLILIGVYNYFIYGGFLKFGGREAISVTRRVMEAPHLLKGLYYYLLSTGKGFFLFNLPLILLLVSLPAISAKRRKEAVLFILIFICQEGVSFCLGAKISISFRFRAYFLNRRFL
jgi:hypothetical protein